jgi:hypothetical protein
MAVNANLILSRLIQAGLITDKDPTYRAVREKIQELAQKDEAYNDGMLFDGFKYALMKDWDVTNDEIIKTSMAQSHALKAETQYFCDALNDIGRPAGYAAAAFYVENQAKYSKDDVIFGMRFIERNTDYRADIAAAIEQAKEELAKKSK